MLNQRLARLGRWGRTFVAVPVWSSGVGLARTVLALATAATIACSGVSGLGVWCLEPANLAWGRWLSIAILLVVASGWRPRITAMPHWWVSWSLTANATIQDGGDQITTVLTLALLGICLTDPRRWHWQAVAPTQTPGVRHIVARVSLLLVHLQVCVLYFQASVAKLGVPEWANGTAMWYWSHHPEFGSSSLLRPVTDPLTDSPYGVALLSWGSIALEFTLALAILMRQSWRFRLLAAGITFHAFIALDMGLVSFFAAMTSALLLYLLPVGHQLVWPGVVWEHVRPAFASTVDIRLPASRLPGMLRTPGMLRMWRARARYRD
jgi:antimicrobial peptide system SdpB family protein